MIHTLTAVKTACNKIVKSAYPNIPIYGTDVLDGYKMPSFFAEIRMSDYAPAQRFQRQYQFTYYLTYCEKTHNEETCLAILDKLTQAFGREVKVGKRRLLIRGIGFEWIGQNENIMQMSVEFAQVTELTGQKEISDMIEEVTINGDTTITEGD